MSCEVAGNTPPLDGAFSHKGKDGRSSCPTPLGSCRVGSFPPRPKFRPSPQGGRSSPTCPPHLASDPHPHPTCGANFCAYFRDTPFYDSINHQQTFYTHSTLTSSVWRRRKPQAAYVLGQPMSHQILLAHALALCDTAEH